MDLFDYMRENTMKKESPLASRLRPRTLDEVVGQQHIIGKDRLLYRAIKADKISSVIFYGPPGTGKTTLAKVIANTTSADFRQINATVAGKKDMEAVVEQAKEQGYVETMFGRRRYLPELASSNFNMRAFGERVARNMPIQGTAADIIKIAMIRVEDRLRKEGMKSRLILQVHDELIVEAPEDEAEKAAAVLTEEMRSAAQLSVPLIADAGIGKSWFDAKAG